MSKPEFHKDIIKINDIEALGRRNHQEAEKRCF